MVAGAKFATYTLYYEATFSTIVGQKQFKCRGIIAQKTHIKQSMKLTTDVKQLRKGVEIAVIGARIGSL